MHEKQAGNLADSQDSLGAQLERTPKTRKLLLQ
jgi:hypothetical protein